jgi:hypothetical protein
MKENKFTILNWVSENFCDSNLLRFRLRQGPILNYGSGSATLTMTFSLENYFPVPHLSLKRNLL